MFVALEGNDTLVNVNPDAVNFDGPGNLYVVSQDNLTTIRDFNPRSFSNSTSDMIVVDHDPADGPEPQVEVRNLDDYRFEVLLDGELVVQGTWFSAEVTEEAVVFRDVSETGLEAVALRAGAPTDFPDAPRNPTADDGTGLTLVGDNGPDTFVGTDNNDTLIGNRGTDNLSGGAGDDFIDGGLSSEFVRQDLSGGAGNDVVIGAGLDRISGDAGDDVLVAQDGGNFATQALFGGSGSDLFVIEDVSSIQTGSAGVTAFDFDGLEDRLVIDLPDGTSASSLNVVVLSDTRVQIDLGSDPIVELRGVNLTDFSVGDILIRDTSENGYDYAEIVAG